MGVANPQVAITNCGTSILAGCVVKRWPLSLLMLVGESDCHVQHCQERCEKEQDTTHVASFCLLKD